jgi:hypothetical protein
MICTPLAGFEEVVVPISTAIMQDPEPGAIEGPGQPPSLRQVRLVRVARACSGTASV